MKTLILLIDVDNELQKQAKQYNESTGFIIYHKQDNIARLAYRTGYGKPETVEPADNKLNAVQRLITEFPLFGAVEYHTHSRGTITETYKEVGDYYRTHLSRGDIQEIEDNLKLDKNYAHILVSEDNYIPVNIELNKQVVSELSPEGKLQAKNLKELLDELARD